MKANETVHVIFTRTFTLPLPCNLFDLADLMTLVDTVRGSIPAENVRVEADEEQITVTVSAADIGERLRSIIIRADNEALHDSSHEHLARTRGDALRQITVLLQDKR